jgi:hypothetical protein
MKEKARKKIEENRDIEKRQRGKSKKMSWKIIIFTVFKGLRQGRLSRRKLWTERN